jgi:hypothetical protein
MNGRAASDPLTDDLLERSRGRFYGKYRGSVTEVEEGGRGRIKAKVPSVLGTQATGWCDPCVPYAGDGVGIAFLPEVGAGVWIEFEAGDPSYPIWSGCYWRDGEMPEDVGPKKKIIRTKAGHQVLFDDDEESIKITDPNGNEITIDSGGVKIARGSYSVEVTDSKVDVNGGCSRPPASSSARTAAASASRARTRAPRRTVPTSSARATPSRSRAAASARPPPARTRA